METLVLTPRQLLILYLTAARDTGYRVINPKDVVNILMDMRDYKQCRFIPALNKTEAEQALGMLPYIGLVVDTLSLAEIYKLFKTDDKREEFFNETAGHVGEFVRQVMLLPPLEFARDPKLT